MSSKGNSMNASSPSRGFTHAIFSSAPINFNKENAPPSKNSRRDNEQKADQFCRIGSKRLASNLRRSKSATMLQRLEPVLGSKSASEEILETPLSCSSNGRPLMEKTPISQFCTPRRANATESKVRNNFARTMLTKTPRKKYFSDLNQPPATPDYFNVVQMETPRSRQDIAVDEQTICEGETSNLTVGVRVRPLNMKELSDPRITAIIESNGQNVTVDCDTSRHTFMYDHCFVSYADSTTKGHASQETVFRNMVLPLVNNAFEGYNACLFAYGQTGSGKSYSMMGTDTGSNVAKLNSEAGIIPRFCHEIFTKSTRNSKTVASTVEISYFEIYNEKIHDLLATGTCGGKRAPLKVREHPVFGPYVVDLSQHGVESYDDLQGWLKVGNSQRATAATGMNEKSSRSHSIFSVVLTQTQLDAAPSGKKAEPSRRSKINLVDLAGSERLSQTCASGDRLREGVSINKSLLTLGKVIASLAESTSNRKRGFVPYRESVLTWLLRESLGGNSRTAMLGTVSPANIHLEETLATLRYACQARAIVNRVRINEDSHDRLIRELKAEVSRLRGIRENYERQLEGIPKKLLEAATSDTGDNSDAITKEKEIEILRDQLKRTEEQLLLSQKSWSEKLRDAVAKKNTELKHLRRRGIALEIEFDEKRGQPCLVNLAADPILSGTLLYLIPRGLVRIGRRSEPGSSSNDPEIVLDGPLVKQRHCTIENDAGRLTLSPEMDGDTYVNGQIVTGRIFLKHGDRLVIGGNHYFRVCNPQDDNSSSQSSVQPVDFEFAHSEIIRIQQEKLRAELEESKQKVIRELESAKRDVEIQLGCQKSTYEQQIRKLGSSLEQQKAALAEVNRRKRELELEKERLASEIESNDRVRRIQQEESRIALSPYRSNFLQDLESILNETTADAEWALNPEIRSEGVSLREMQLMVREASERCREVGINYITEHLNESLHQLSMDASALEATATNGSTESNHGKTFDDMIDYIKQIEEASRNLTNLCDLYENRETSADVKKSLEKMQDIVATIRETLRVAENGSSGSVEETVIENTASNSRPERRFFADPVTGSPSKSEPRVDCPFFQTGPKSPTKSIVGVARRKFEALINGDEPRIEDIDEESHEDL